MKLQAPPEWDIELVPERRCILGFPDYLALWSSLGVGLLVLLAGALLVPGLGLGQALLAMLIGSVIGSLLLAVAGVSALSWAFVARIFPPHRQLLPLAGCLGFFLSDLACRLLDSGHRHETRNTQYE